ncbi:phosphatase PAP2 family protein [Streptomyces sp. NPDC001296]
MADRASSMRRRIQGLAPTPDGGTRPRWWAEWLLVGLLYAVYDTTRGLQGGWTAVADHNGQSILRWEHAVHFAPEQPLNQVLHKLPVLAVLAAYFYATLHFVVTPAVLIWLHRMHPERYRGARSWLAMATMSALIGFWLLPATPPRLLPRAGIHGSVADVQQWGWWNGETSAPDGLGGLVNEHAAMPSLHVGWALWSGWLLYRHARRRTLRILGLAYPVLTTLDVVATGNHYLVDAIAGAALIVFFGALQRRIRIVGRRAAAMRWGPSTAVSLVNDPSASSSWLHSRHRGRAGSYLPLHLEDAFLVSADTEELIGGWARFRIADRDTSGHGRRAWRPRAALRHQLAGTSGELRLVRNYDGDQGTAWEEVTAMLTLNGVTDAVPLGRLNVVGPLPSIADGGGHVAAVRVDVPFRASVWGLARTPHTRCHVHLQAQVRVLPQWPVQ